MRKLRLKVPALLVGVLLLMNACQQGQHDFSKAMTMLPQDAAVVMCINAESLQSKMPEGAFGASLFTDAAKVDDDSELFQLLFSDSLTTGIDKQELTFFALTEAQYGAAFLLDDEVAFATFIAQLLSEVERSSQIVHRAAYKVCTMDSVVLVWDDAKALLMSACDENSIVSYFSQSADEGLVSHSYFQTFYAERKEFSVWMSMEKQVDVLHFLPQFKQGMAMPPMKGFEAMYEGVFASYYLEFLDGELVMSGKMQPEDKAREVLAQFYNDKPSEKLLAAVPGESYLLMTSALNLPEFLEIYKGIPQFEMIFDNPDNQDIINSIKGDVLLSISGFASGPMPIPNAVIGVSVEDETLLSSIRSIEGVQQVEKEGYIALVIQMFQVFVAQKDDILLISTDEDVIKTFAQGRELADNLAKSEHRKALTSAAYYYMNLNLNEYPAALTALLQSKMGDSYTRMNEAMCLDEMYAYYDAKSCESEMHLVLKDKKENSLTALVAMVEAFVALKE